MKLFRVMFLTQHHVHKSSPAALLSCADQCWLYFINVTAAFSCFPQHLVRLKQSTAEIPVLELVSFHCLPAQKWRQSRNGGGFTEWGRHTGTDPGHCRSAQGHSVAHAESVGGRFLPDLLHGHVLGQNAAANTQILLAECPCSFEWFRVFTKLQTRIWNGGES